MSAATAPAPEGRRVTAVVATVCVLGAASLAGVAALARILPRPSDAPTEVTWWLVGLLLLATAVAEVVTVPVPHGDALEELTFFEVAVVIGVLTLPPVVAVVVPLAGLLLVHVVLRRPLIKAAFNLGSYAAASSALVATYLLVGHGQPRFSAWSVIGLVVGTLLFAVINLVALVELFHALEGLPLLEGWRDEWMLSLTMAIGGVAVGASVVAMAEFAPALVPLAAFPALALWSAYRSAAQRAREREQARLLVDFGLALATSDDLGGDRVLEPAIDAVRRLAGGRTARLATGPEDADLLAVVADTDATAVAAPPGLLPEGWDPALVLPLEVGRTEPAALVVGGLETEIGPDRLPLLGALGTAIAGALRARDAGRALLAETESLRAVVDHSRDGIAVVTADGRVRLWSPALVRMTGVDMSGQSVDEVAEPAATLLRVDEQHARAYQAPPRSMTVTLPSGETRDLTVYTTRAWSAGYGAPEGGAPFTAVYTVHDDTAVRRADRLKADFVATISHELRTPITPIKGYAQLLARRGDRMEPQRRAEALELIAERADHLGRLVDDLLLASRVTGPTKLTIQASDLDLRDLVRRTVASFPRLADRVELDLPDQPVLVRCDSHRAGQCIANLLSNAEKYTPVDTPVEVRLSGPGGGDRMAVVIVRDHGPGIPPDEQDKVFQRFYRIEDPFTMRTGGSGLGLHISLELAKAMGGSLTLVSQPGDGCTFALALPLASVSTEDPGGAWAQGARTETTATGEGTGSLRGEAR
ncbi:MAG: PAS domain-containing sensor histidine kinase [Candidatus Nanopelagicales bacterium]